MTEIGGQARLLRDLQLGCYADMERALAGLAETLRALLGASIPVRRDLRLRLRRDAAEAVLSAFVDRRTRRAWDDAGRPRAPVPRVLSRWMRNAHERAVSNQTSWMAAQATPAMSAWAGLAPHGVASELEGAAAAAFASDFVDTRGLGYDPLHVFISRDGYRLSDSIWPAAQRTRDKIDDILRAGIEEGVGVPELSARLEDSLRPERVGLRTRARRVIDLPGQPRRIQRVRWGRTASYDAMRLARTEVTASFGRATMATARENPWVDRMRWRLSPQHPKVDVCDQLAGVYPLDDFPAYPAHPQCICVASPVTRPQHEAIAAINADLDAPRPGQTLNAGRPAWPLPDNATRKDDPAVQEEYRGARRRMQTWLREKRLRTGRGKFNRKWLEDSKEYVLSSVSDRVNESYWKGTRISTRSWSGKAAARARGGMRKMFEVVRGAPDLPGPPPPSLVWRGMRGDVAADIREMAIGEVWKNKGYTSTSLSPTTAHSFGGDSARTVVMEILPRNKGVDFSAIADNFDEEEFLIDKGARFRFVGSRVVNMQLYGESRKRKITLFQFVEELLPG